MNPPIVALRGLSPHQKQVARLRIIGIVAGLCFVLHVVSSHWRGHATQFLWPLLGGVIAAHLHRGSELSPLQAGVKAGLWGMLAIMVVGAPLFSRVLPPAAPNGVSPAVVVALGLFSIGVLFMIVFVLGVLSATVLFRRRDAWAISPFLPQGTRIWRPALLLFFLGLVGVFSLLLIPLPPARTEIAARVPLAVRRWAVLVNPAILLFVACAVGARYATRFGLRSHVAAFAGAPTHPKQPFVREIPRTVAIGLATAAAVVVANLLVQPLLGEEWSRLNESTPPRVQYFVAGILYGGITEEILLRWGLMSALVALLLHIRRRAREAPRPAEMWSAISLSALLFGLGHLPAAAMWVQLTPLIAAHIVLLNAGAGFVFGWIFWRYSLEAAMLAHASGHVVFGAVAYLS